METKAAQQHSYIDFTLPVFKECLTSETISCDFIFFSFFKFIHWCLLNRELEILQNKVARNQFHAEVCNQMLPFPHIGFKKLEKQNQLL